MKNVINIRKCLLEIVVFLIFDLGLELKGINWKFGVYL